MTSVIRTTTLAIAALGLSAGLAMAQAATPEFATVDADADGSITLTELQAAIPTVTEEAFAAADADGSGGLSAEEYAALAAG